MPDNIYLSNLILDHFTRNALLNANYLKKACATTFSNTQYNFSPIEKYIMSPFIAFSFKMKKDKDESYRPVIEERTIDKVSKDLYQFLTKGALGDVASDNFDESKKVYKKGEKEYGGPFSLLEGSGKKGLGKRPFAASGKKYFEVLKTLNEFDVSKDSRKDIYDFKSKIKTRYSFDSIEKSNAVISSLVDYFDKSYDKSKADQSLKNSVVLLATLLSLKEIDIEKNGSEMEEAIKEVVPYLYRSLLTIPNKEVRKISEITDKAVELAEQRIKSLNEKLPDDNKYACQIKNYFHDLSISNELDAQILNFNDLHVSFNDKGSNYKFSYVDNEGKVRYIDDASKIFVSQEKKLHEVVRSLYLFDKSYAKLKGKNIDTFGETAEILLLNLLIIDNSEKKIDESIKKKLQEIFAVPLLKCYQNMGKDEIKTANKNAIEGLKEIAELRKSLINEEDVDKLTCNYGKKEVLLEDEMKRFIKLFIKECDIYLQSNGLLKQESLSKKNKTRTALELVVGCLNLNLPDNNYIYSKESKDELKDILTKEIQDNKIVEAAYTKLFEVADAAKKYLEKNGGNVDEKEMKDFRKEVGLTKKNAKEIVEGIVKK